MVIKYIECLTRPEFDIEIPAEDIGVITPYKRQVNFQHFFKYVYLCYLIVVVHYDTKQN